MKRKSLFSGINGLLTSVFLLDFGFSLAGIFIPLYIFKITHSFVWVFAFYLLFDLTIIVFTLPAARLVARFGSDKISFTGTISRSLFFLFLILSGKNILFLVPAAVLWGLAIPLYWLPFHLSVVGSDQSLAFGKDSAKINLVSKLATIAGPVLGGVIIQTSGFTSLYLFGFVFLIASGLPLFFDKYEFKFPDISLKTLKENLPIRQMPRLFLGFFGTGLIDRFYGLTWPFYVFLLIGSYKFLGSITSAGLFASFILLIIVGRLADRFGSRILRLTIPLNFFNLIGRIFLTGRLSLFLVDLVYQLVSIFIWVPLDQLSYQTAVQTKKLEFFLSRELAIHSGSLLAALILILSLSFFGLNWPLAFALAAFSLLLIGQLGFAKEEGIRSAGVVLIRKDGAILMQKRDNKSNIVFPDHWCLPGGKIRIGEIAPEAASRELKQETGYQAKSLSFLTEESYSLPAGGKVTRHIFWAEYDNFQKIKCSEGEKMEFLKLEDFTEKKIFPGHENLCRLALEKFLKI
ncbi:MAG: MFS transporter [bacterium]|nr:MFS transporter [bacterium]